MPVTVLIPALNPSTDLVRVVDELLAHDEVKRVVVINDGSASAHAAVFAEVAGRARVEVLRHAVNLGKGAGLRTGMNHFLCTAAADEILVTADADGQHLTKDILAVGRRAAEAPGSLVLGARAFSGDVPLRSRLGNVITGIVFRLFIGQSVTDTQTGLRAIPRSLMPALLRVKASGYEFELEMLILSARSKVPIESVTIQTVYLDNNASSHFDPIRDSARIYFVFVRFLSSSALTALLDNLVFAIAFQASQSLVASMVLGRLVASAFNFAVNKRLVFHSKDLFWKVLAKYVSLVIVLGSIAFALIHFLVAQFQWNAYAAKLVVEGVLLLCSFVLQRDVVFAEKSPPISVREPEATGPRT